MIIGFTVVRNALDLDFCVDLTVKSLLPVCDEVWVCDSDSTDGTMDWLRKMFADEPKLHLINKRWSDPVGYKGWLLEWMQYTQHHLPRGPGISHLYLDADEVLDPGSYDTLRSAPADRCFWFHRYNYWRDVRHEAPFGTVCSHQVARFGPSDLPMHSDEIHDGRDFPRGEPMMRVRGLHHDALKIHHYGFLRKRDAMFRKIEGNIRAFFGGTQDSRIIEAMQHPDRHWTEFAPFTKPLREVNVPQPAMALAWLKERDAL